MRNIGRCTGLKSRAEGIVSMPFLADNTGDRGLLERFLEADLGRLTFEADWLARSFAAENGLSANDFRAVLFVTIADVTGTRISAGDLRRRMGLSGAAITYLVERLTESGHLRRESDPNDRRRVILRYADEGMAVARRFLQETDGQNRRALKGLTDSDLEAAHRAFAAMLRALTALRVELDDEDAKTQHKAS
jgi:DNA-binding MarR family transcriptional regulator